MTIDGLFFVSIVVFTYTFFVSFFLKKQTQEALRCKFLPHKRKCNAYSLHNAYTFTHTHTHTHACTVLTSCEISRFWILLDHLKFSDLLRTKKNKYNLSDHSTLGLKGSPQYRLYWIAKKTLNLFYHMIRVFPCNTEQKIVQLASHCSRRICFANLLEACILFVGTVLIVFQRI